MLAYCLHTIAYRETSAIVELFTREHGRVAAVAKGAKRHGSALRNVLMQFQPINITLSGKSELRTLTQAQWVGGVEAPQGSGLIIGFYFNELLVKLLAREDPHPALFDAYQRALGELAVRTSPDEVQPLQGFGVAEPLRDQDPAGARYDDSLRRFEWTLLRETGYAPDLARDAAGQKIEPQGWYRWQPEGGFLKRHEDSADGGTTGPWFSGAVLQMLSGKPSPMASGTSGAPPADPAVRQQAKQLTRAVMAHCLEGQSLKTRQLLVDLHRL